MVKCRVGRGDKEESDSQQRGRDERTDGIVGGKKPFPACSGSLFLLLTYMPVVLQHTQTHTMLCVAVGYTYLVGSEEARKKKLRSKMSRLPFVEFKGKHTHTYISVHVNMRKTNARIVSIRSSKLKLN